MADKLLVESGVRTHNGTVRDQNEDRFANRADYGLWAVADGVGGIARGEYAAELVTARIEAIGPVLPLAERRARVRDALDGAHAELVDQAARDGSRTAPCTTIVALLVEEAEFVMIWAGDSRGYRLRDGVLTQMTRDHTLVQELVDLGAIGPDDAEGHPRANIVTRAVGQADDPLEFDEVAGSLRAGDRLMLCSDGLSKSLPPAVIADLMAAADAAGQLLSAALAAGATDNVTVVTVDVT